MTNYLVTGGAGFIGSNLCEELIKRGHNVRVIDNLSVSDLNVPFLKKIGVDFKRADIINYEQISGLFTDIDTVIHLAAMNRAQRSINNPISANEVNITGTLNCLEAARQSKVKKFVNISSSSVYASRDSLLKEDMPTSPPHPYGVGKLSAEHYTRLYYELYGMDTLTLRYFSVYGPRQLGFIDKAGVVAKFIYNAIEDKSLEIYGDGTKKRNFSYVKDVVNMTILASEKKEAINQVINVAAKREIDINYLAKIVKKVTKKPINVIHGNEIDGDPSRNPPNIEKSKKILGYESKYDFEKGINDCYEWYIKTNSGNVDVDAKICVVGLGYVGLPLGVKFGLRNDVDVYGLDLNEKKIKELKENHDSMNEVETNELIRTNIKYSINPKIISKANFVIVAVPTPIDEAKKPDITLLLNASKMVGENLKKGSTVVFESTVYPGCTQEDCVPVIEKASGLKCGIDWFVGYSPERVNPGDKEHTIDKIVKVVSGMNDEVKEQIGFVYDKIIKVGTHRASSIKVAEAAKVIENTQRDINIALMNELAIIFEKMNIPTSEVLAAAGTKWNFLKFSPGLVGGHCIGVDPYYLVHKAEILGLNPQIITAGRKINDDMPIWVANQIIKFLIKADKVIKGSKLLLLGLTFKENVNDMRNSKAKELIKELKEFGIEVIGYDPYLTKKEVKDEFSIKNITKEEFDLYKSEFSGIIMVTSHKEFFNLNFKNFKKLCVKNSLFYDIRNIFSKNKVESEGFIYKSL